MSRLSIRPRPLDFNKKLPLVKSVKDLEDDDSSTNTRNSLLVRFTSEVEIEVQPVPTKKLAAEIPTPQYVIVDTYERDYSRTFVQPTSYLRARGVWADIGEFVEYDLDNEDEDWLHEYNREKKVLGAEKFEAILYKLEVLDHKARERAGLITSTLGSPIPPHLTFDAAVGALQSDSIMYGVFQSIYSYWKSKRERWQKPALRRLQPPPPATDTNPYNVFRPREKTHRLHTRRMQRRENNVQSFEKLRQVRQNLEQAKTILQALLLREEKKRDVTESEITLQRIQLKYKNETELFEDSLALPGFPPFPGKVVSSEEEMVDSDDVYNSGQHTQPLVQNMPFTDVKHGMISTETMRRGSRRQNTSLPKVDDEPIMLFTKSLNTEKLAASGIIPPSDSPKPEGGFVRSCSSMLRGRMGRGGRIVFDRCNVLMNSADDGGEASYLPPIPQQIAYP